MDAAGFNWTLLTIVGPLVLVLVIAWAILRNRRSRASDAESEAGLAESMRKRIGSIATKATTFPDPGRA